MLKFDLQFFNEEPNEGINVRGGDDLAVDNNPSDNIKSGEKATEHMIPKSRFDEVNNKFKEMKAQLDELLAQKADEERKAKERQGHFEELYNTTSHEYEAMKQTYEKTEARKNELESVVNSLVETKLKNVPEEFKDLVPEHLSAEAKLDWLNKAEEKGLFNPKKSNTPIGGQANPPKQPVDLSKLSPGALLRHAYGSK